jgi:hypothetical protein
MAFNSKALPGSNASLPYTLFHSFAFGLHLEANREIPGLLRAPCQEQSDVRVWLDAVPPTIANYKQSAQLVPVGGSGPQSFTTQLTVWTVGNFFKVRYEDGTEFYVNRAGTEIWATWPESLTVQDTATYLLGPIFSLVLRLRGTISLHASSVRIGDVAVALVGPQGAGKSTTAASFATAGYPVLTDDLAPLHDGGHFFEIIPTYPNIRLWPSSVSLLFGAPEALPRITPTWNKRYLQLGSHEHRFEPAPVRLAAIYFFHSRTDDASAPRVEPEPLHDGLIKLIGNIGANYLLDQEAPAATFDLLKRLANAVPLRRLIPHTDPQYLPQLRDLVVADIGSLPAGDGRESEWVNSRV